MNGKKTSGLGWLGLIAGVGIFLAVRKIFPFLGTVLLIVGIILAVLVVALVVAVVAASNRKDPDAEAKQQREDVLVKGRKNLLELRQIAMRIKDSRIREKNKEVCRTVEKILRVLREQPEDIPAASQFLNYYLPTSGKILTQFARVEASGVDTGDMAQSTLSCLGNIQAAAERQYANLFEDDLLDLSVEMEALTEACKRDGLLEETQKDAEEKGIHLTL